MIIVKLKLILSKLKKKKYLLLNYQKEFHLPEKIFNSSYRTIIDINLGSYESYNQYKFNYDLIDGIITDYLLKNKKLLNDDITEFIYNNEGFNFRSYQLMIINIKGESKIYEAIYNQKDNLLDYFIKLFEDNDGIIFDKATDIFDYYLKEFMNS